MTSAIATAQSATLSTAQVIESAIPVTHDRGDALNAAHQILGASASYCFGKPSLIPTEVYRMVMHAQNAIGKQYTEWLKGGE